MHGTLTRASGEHATRRLLEQLWQRNVPTVHSRLTLFHAAADAARDGSLTAELRAQAAGEAHKLAGSLGMFGYPRGTDLARTIEELLDNTHPLDPAHLTGLTHSLTTELFPAGA